VLLQYKCATTAVGGAGATDDDSSNAAGYKIIFHNITLRQAQGDSSFLTFAALKDHGSWVMVHGRTAVDHEL